MKQFFRPNAPIVHVLFFTTLGIILSQGAYSLHEVLSATDNKERQTQVLLVNKSRDILSDISRLNATLEVCTKTDSTCSNAQVQLFTNELSQQIDHFHALISNEKSLASSSGILGFDLIQLYIKKYNRTFDLNELKNSLSTAFNNSTSIIDNLLLNHTRLNQEKQNSHLYTLLMLNGSLILVFMLYYLFNTKLLQIVQAEKKQISDTFKSISNDLKSIDHRKVKERMTDISTNSIEKNIYAKLLSSYEQLEAQKSKTDLYQRLYNLLGYEVRGITNTIQGGVKLLIKDTNESGALLAKEIMSATNTLENLADNFNRLSNIEAMSHNKTINFDHLISELIVLTSTKAKQQSKHIECFVDNAIPLKMHGNQTGLFWLLLLQVSNALSISTQKKVLLTTTCTSSDRVDKLTIHLNLFLYLDNYKSIQQIESLQWENAPKRNVTNDELANNLLNGVHNYTAETQDLGYAEKLTISFDVNTSEYQTHNNRLAGRTILLCGTSAMQVDVIAKTLTNQGANVLHAHTANDIFKSMKQLKANDGIFLTDNIKGITLDSFCKTLKARLSKRNIKLFLSVSNSADIDDIYKHVDYVFYHPFTPIDFIGNIINTLESNSDKPEELNSRFLIVEDDKVQQFILNKILSDFEFSAEGVDDGSKALSLIQENDFDIIFMDCIMPGMGGMEATALIRQYEKEHALPPTTIIGATALTSNKEHKQCIDAGMDYVISKPYKNEEIYSVIKKYMAIRKVG
ncbi:response regulator [Aliivibrio fischeri]|uniref:response regulator n=1 Tax=Aliivibrio fischeri TaxID=668 RepID=UPI0012D9867B|nr:response regulator [Aliivibrio fischeri]MUK38699.1 response regulator [Aliivibrio fischeri]MUL04859.1 response regulator [Aliivibrio fischeri]